MQHLTPETNMLKQEPDSLCVRGQVAKAKKPKAGALSSATDPLMMVADAVQNAH